ncbi:hypothetical protein [Breoghania sp.]|uniref:hypothetical protein n=1 Tax=Breoghania sp. TaxID=2065378 RepID=UPI0026077DFB|nr:hypothetical protein [Breoghania sp.]MDJ0932148.1 hypothetical protein [Breoghania sp.]
MFKVSLVGLAGVVVAIGLAIFGYQAGYFDSFRQTQSPATGSIAEAPADAGTPSDKAAPTDAANREQAAEKAGESAAQFGGETTAEKTATSAQKKREVVPAFDVVRVERSGDAVVAGLAEGNATVALVANGKVIAKTKANGAGEWAIVLDDPLKARRLRHCHLCREGGRSAL